MIRLFLMYLGFAAIWVSWCICLIIDIIRAIIDKPALIAWWVIIVWFAINVVAIVLGVRFLFKKGGKIIAKDMKTGAKFVGNVMDGMEKEFKN